MKKNYVMRFAAVLLVLVLLSTCVVSGTFAKYVTSGSAEDTATVAKWGVKVTASGQDAKVTEIDGSQETHVISNTGEKMAPGTKGSLGKISVSGTPEVAVTVTHVATVTLEGWLVDGAYYCPLVVSVNGTPVATGSDAATFAANIKKAIEDLSKDEAHAYAAGTTLADSVEVTWEWAIDVDDVKDTALGDLAADGTVSTIKVEITTTVTQVD